MTGAKRSLAESDSSDQLDPRHHGALDDIPSPPSPAPPTKRRRLAPQPQTPLPLASSPSSSTPAIPPPSGRDLLTPLSDELLLRILSFLSLPHLLAVAPVSHRFYDLAADSQLWKALYYGRFVLPRAMRIPGFRDGTAGGGSGSNNGSGNGHKLHYSGRRRLWADGRRGGVVRQDEDIGQSSAGRIRNGLGLTKQEHQLESPVGRRKEEEEKEFQPVNWKRQYKIRHNWARGKCAVEELKLGHGADDGGPRRKMLVKVVEGIAVTADKTEGLRAWDLKTRSLIVGIEIGEVGSDAEPSCIAVDEAEFERGVLDIALGFDDGSFGVWRLLTKKRQMDCRYRHEKSSNGDLVAMAFSYPYLLTATKAVLVSLYTFDVPTSTGKDTADQPPKLPGEETSKLDSPYLLTSLDSYTSRPPLALSLRRTRRTTVASVAYTFSTRRGWSIGLQDLHIHQPATGIQSTPEITSTRIAYTTPVETIGPSRPPLSPPATPHRKPHNNYSGSAGWPSTPSTTATSSSPIDPNVAAVEPGPTTLCYTHPYLLATLPDNTLVLHMCTSTASSLTIAEGIRLWGHTSGISDAEITARGKAVSVSSRGEEMRVWELEGRSAATAAAGGGGVGASSRSVEIRPRQWLARPSRSEGGDLGLGLGDPARDWDERRNWVGFDDEMVIVLKERRGARESLMVYDFT
ncbi:F-box only protein 15 [Dichotomopilus funicola]|uniref:F-box only protein 15 n=1 Tax=Dichotomopilus funicola TaxID=1934379 RepID=A0AAN6V337_9PEZI|nr:F-box only protein 15 [Dichotomopilus funicola]